MKHAFGLRRKLWKLLYGYRYPSVLVTVPVWLFLLWVSWTVSGNLSNILKPGPPPDNDLSHFRRSRSLRHYFDNIDLLIQPSSLPCSNLEEVPVLVIVTSAPSNWEQRQAIRNSWGKHLPTYFLLGVDGTRNDNQLIDNYVEAKEYGDMVVYDFRDHYQNLTLKTALMMKWTLERCPQAQFLYKTDDDMFINPWVLKEVLKERGADGMVLGHLHNDSALFRDPTHKWFLPRWLFPEDVIDRYITGPGYLMNGGHIQDMLKAAHRIPLHNIEDVYFTYNVAKKGLGYELVHDHRLSSYRPQPKWLPIKCAYWPYASMHSFKPQEILRTWDYIEPLAEEYSRGRNPCSFYDAFIKRFVVFN